MKINWKVRFKNKTWLASFVAMLVAFVYDFLAAFDITPKMDEGTVMQFAELVLMALAMYGVIADPTTKGLGDSQQALGYTEPKEE